ncbi:hypothetical protein [Leucobacter sp. NPDC077196]|uniref:hypothetical protein n=1 Tax=Leucobacter sp. NPDC077196 TaxID=3154959 RepID=UPI003416621D
MNPPLNSAPENDTAPERASACENASAPEKASRTPGRVTRFAPYLLLLAVFLCALYSVVAMVIDEESGFERAFDSVLAVAVFTGLVWIDTLIGKRRPLWFRTISYGSSVFLLAFWVTDIWAEDIGGPLIVWFAHPAILIFIRLALLYVDLIRVMLRTWNVPLTVFTGALTGVTGVAAAVLLTISLHTWGKHLLEIEIYGRIWAATALLSAFGMVALLLAGVMMRSRAPRIAVPETQPVSPYRPPLMWPTLHDGTPLRATPSGAPDFASLPVNAVLAWPRYIDGTPVPPRPTGARDLQHTEISEHQKASI